MIDETFNNYTIIKDLSSNDMNKVKLAFDNKSQSFVVLKIISDSFQDEETAKKRFRNEVMNSLILNHKNIARVIDYKETNSSLYMVSQFIPGISLNKLLSKKPLLSEPQALNILIQLCEGLQYAHEMGIIHRDIKPSNIIVEKNGTTFITDFGISIFAGQAQLTQKGKIMGSAQYISPEQAIGEKASQKSDIYSLGIVAFEMLMGVRPFSGRTAVDIANAHVTSPIPKISREINHELAMIVLSMLSKDPIERPENISKVLLLLKSISIPGNVTFDEDYFDEISRDLNKSLKKASSKEKIKMPKLVAPTLPANYQRRIPRTVTSSSLSFSNEENNIESVNLGREY